MTAESQGRLCAGDILRGVNAQRAMASLNDPNSCAVLEGAKLFKFFGALERGGPPADELHDEIAAVSVDADMPKGLKAER